MNPAGVTIVGLMGPTDVGTHLLNAASGLGIHTNALDYRAAYEGHAAMRAFNWKMRGRRPVRLDTFTRLVMDSVTAHTPELLVATGIAPITIEGLRTAR